MFVSVFYYYGVTMRTAALTDRLHNDASSVQPLVNDLSVYRRGCFKPPKLYSTGGLTSLVVILCLRERKSK